MLSSKPVSTLANYFPTTNLHCIQSASLTSWNQLEQFESSDKYPQLWQLNELFENTENKPNDIPDKLLNWTIDNLTHIIECSHTDIEFESSLLNFIKNMLSSCNQYHSHENKTDRFLQQIANIFHNENTPCLNLNPTTLCKLLHCFQNRTNSPGMGVVMTEIAAYFCAPNCKQLSTTDISKSAACLCAMTNSPETEALLNAIAEHMDSPYCEQLSPKEIEEVLSGIQYHVLCAATEAILHAVSKHIALYDGQWFSSKISCDVLYYLRNQCQSTGVERLLAVMKNHIDLQNCEQFSAKRFSIALYGFKNQTRSNGTEAVVSFIAQHMTSINGDQFTVNMVGMGLYGIQGLQGCSAAPKLLLNYAKIIHSISRESFCQFERTKELFYAEIINCLQGYLLSKNVSEREAAKLVVINLNHHNLVPAPYNPSKVSDLDRAIYEAFGASGNLFGVKVQSCDLHRSSYGLASKLVQLKMQQFLRLGNVNKIVFIFGGSNHKPQHKGRMQEEIKCVTDLYHRDVELMWGKTSVSVIRKYKGK